MRKAMATANTVTAILVDLLPFMSMVRKPCRKTFQGFFHDFFYFFKVCSSMSILFSVLPLMLFGMESLR